MLKWSLSVQVTSLYLLALWCALHNEAKNGAAPANPPIGWVLNTNQFLNHLFTKNKKIHIKTKTDALWWLLYRAVGCRGLLVCQLQLCGDNAATGFW